MPDTITGLAAALRDGRTTPRALLAAAMTHVERSEKDLNAYLTVTRDLAEQQADAAARTLAEHPDTASPLCGIPMALKDVLCVDGIETTAGSKMLHGFKPPYTGTAAQRLFDAGAVCVGAGALVSGRFPGSCPRNSTAANNIVNTATAKDHLRAFSNTWNPSPISAQFASAFRPPPNYRAAPCTSHGPDHDPPRSPPHALPPHALRS